MAQELKPIKLGSVELGEYWVYDAEEVDAVLAEKDAEIRRLQRALWVTRAERADDRARIFYFNDLETMLDIDGFSHDSKKKKGHKKLTARDWRIIWLKVERKCRAKAEVVQMSELKAYGFPVDHGDFTATVEQFYLKSEADKVIAEKDAENESLLQQNRELCQALQVMYSKEEYDKQKHKRCLAMASLSLEKRETYRAEYEEWCLKWHKRWLELAEKFKGAK